MIETVSNTLELEIDVWSDPGDYPNALASGPLPSYNYASEISGELVLKVNNSLSLMEMIVAIFTLNLEAIFPEDVHEDELNDIACEELPCDVSSATWNIERRGDYITMTVEEFEAEYDDSRDEY